MPPEQPSQPSPVRTRPDADPEPGLDDVESYNSQMQLTACHEDQGLMSDEAPSAAVAKGGSLGPGPQATRLEDHAEDDDDGVFRVRNRQLGAEHIRHVVRLFQCRRCSKPFRNPITLPCGQTICKTCIPETRARTSITYPAFPDRLQGFRCPFHDCARVHALTDCGLDVVLNKVGLLVEEEIARAKLEASELNLHTGIAFKNPWDAAGVPSLQAADLHPLIIQGGRLLSTWSLALDGGLAIEAEVVYTDIAPPTQGRSNEENSTLDTRSLAFLQSIARNEMDCQVCYALLHDPFTTGCGHTFCRQCLHRTLDHSNRCPICRRTLAMNPLLSPERCPSNQSIVRLTELFWPQEKLAREKAVAAETSARHEGLDLPLFVCTLSFPAMPTFLHVFEPRYRLMIRRVLEGNKTFGMVLPKRPREHGDRHFHQLGTLLRIINAQFYPDGRSLVETIGLTRFRVVRFGELDGYTVAKAERIDDVSLEEEGALEVAEAAVEPAGDADHSTEASPLEQNDSRMTDMQTSVENADDESRMPADVDDIHQAEKPQTPQSPVPVTAAQLQTMSTQSLMEFATEFVARMRLQSVPWLTARMLAIYGECPDDPAIFPWWFASMLPVKDLEKYRLLATSSVRERLKICCMWIVEWETTRWSFHHCAIL